MERILHQLRLVVYPIIYRVLETSQVVQDFSHQQLSLSIISCPGSIPGKLKCVGTLFVSDCVVHVCCNHKSEFTSIKRAPIKPIEYRQSTYSLCALIHDRPGTLHTQYTKHPNTFPTKFNKNNSTVWRRSKG